MRLHDRYLRCLIKQTSINILASPLTVHRLSITYIILYILPTLINQKDQMRGAWQIQAMEMHKDLRKNISMHVNIGQCKYDILYYITMYSTCHTNVVQPVSYTVRWRCNAVNFLTNIHERHPIARPSGRDMGCILWNHHLIDILPEILWLFN